MLKLVFMYLKVLLRAYLKNSTKEQNIIYLSSVLFLAMYLTELMGESCLWWNTLAKG